MAKGKRARTKYPALKPELNLKTRYELIDYDYVDKLTEDEKEWLNKFTEEYINASLDSVDLEKNFHNTEDLKKDCYRRNNARNRDILTRAKASNNYVSTDEMVVEKKTEKETEEVDYFEDELSDDFEHLLNDLEKPSPGPDDNGDNSDSF